MTAVVDVLMTSASSARLPYLMRNLTTQSKVPLNPSTYSPPTPHAGLPNPAQPQTKRTFYDISYHSRPQRDSSLTRPNQWHQAIALSGLLINCDYKAKCLPMKSCTACWLGGFAPGSKLYSSALGPISDGEEGLTCIANSVTMIGNPKASRYSSTFARKVSNVVV